ncbi:hypothetical protein BEN78_08395 [Xanthomonas citri pv. mangiferaeindicae]|nr:hypothetical protein BEN78_08395 [Xanthomonas citri pv. mangiferaeindicae]
MEAAATRVATRYRVGSISAPGYFRANACGKWAGAITFAIGRMLQQRPPALPLHIGSQASRQRHASAISALSSRTTISLRTGIDILVRSRRYSSSRNPLP